MNQSQDAFAGTVPENYDRYLVPLIFDAYAVDLAGTIDIPIRGAVLETACGTGVLTRRLCRGLTTGARLIATDLNQAMLDKAQTVIGDTPGLAFRQADATALPFHDDAFDVVACQFGVMFFPDKKAAYREAARVLKPGGRFVFSVWDAMEHNGFQRTVHEATAALFPDDPPRFLEIPFSYHDLNAIKSGLQAAGFGEIEMVVQPRRSGAPSARDAAMALVAGSPLAGDVAARGCPLADAVDHVEAALTTAYGEGPITAPMQAVRISARLSRGR